MTTTPGSTDRQARSRDRDKAGRAHNARPRDSLGRPLPYGSPDVQRQPEGIVRTPKETIVEAQRLLDEGLPFHAHEVFEDAWKSADGIDRVLWKGLAQLAVGLTHLARGNERGANTLLRRGSHAISGLSAESPYGIDITGIVAWAEDMTARLQHEDLAAPSSWPVLRLRRG